MQNSLFSRLRCSVAEDSEGGALVEMAVTLPLVMLIMTGIFSFSTVLYQKLQLAEAVSNAGHYLATARGDTDPCATAIAAVKSSVPGLAAKNITVTLTQNGTALATSCPTTSTSSTLVEGSNVTVLASYPTGLALYGSGYSSIDLGSQISEVVQ
jgi:Flp pilus assembly protein TadG